MLLPKYVILSQLSRAAKSSSERYRKMALEAIAKFTAYEFLYVLLTDEEYSALIKLIIDSGMFTCQFGVTKSANCRTGVSVTIVDTKSVGKETAYLVYEETSRTYGVAYTRLNIETIDDFLFCLRTCKVGDGLGEVSNESEAAVVLW